MMERQGSAAADARRWGGASLGRSRFLGQLASSLSSRLPLTLLTTETLDLDRLRRASGMALDLVETRVIPHGTIEMERASRNYGVFLGDGAADQVPACGSRAGVLVGRPSIDMPFRRLGAALEDGVSPLKGFHRRTVVRSIEVRWTTGDAWIVTHGSAAHIDLFFARVQPRRVGTIGVTVEDANGEVLANVRVRPLRSRVDNQLIMRKRVVLPESPSREGLRVLRLRSDVFVPKDLIDSADGRRLGVASVIPESSVALSAQLRASLSYDRVIVADPEAAAASAGAGLTPELVLPGPTLTKSTDVATRPRRNIVAFAPFAAKLDLQHEMFARAFESVTRRLGRGALHLHLVGSSEQMASAQVRNVRSLIELRDDISLHVDEPWSRILPLLESARMSWHGNETVDGFAHIVALDALRSGCVPLTRTAGVPLVDARHLNGRSWNDANELADLSVELIEASRVRPSIGDAIKRGRQIDELWPTLDLEGLLDRVVGQRNEVDLGTHPMPSPPALTTRS